MLKLKEISSTKGSPIEVDIVPNQSVDDLKRDLGPKLQTNGTTMDWKALVLMFGDKVLAEGKMTFLELFREILITK
jgi:hypothetical protein